MTVLGGVALSPIAASNSVAEPDQYFRLSINGITFRRKGCLSVSISSLLLGISPSISATSLSPFVISFKAVTSFLVCSGKCAPLYPNVVFLCLPRSLTAALFCSFPTEGSHRKIISHSDGHSVVTGFWATKKAGTSMRTDLAKG